MSRRSCDSLSLSPAARREDLASVLAFIDEACGRAGADAAALYATRLAVEEAFLNILTHGYPAGGGGPVELFVSSDPGRILVTISDRAVPFPPESAPKPDLHSDWEERRPGGVGWHLVRSMMDEVHYESTPGRENRLTLVRRIGATSKEDIDDSRG